MGFSNKDFFSKCDQIRIGNKSDGMDYDTKLGQVVVSSLRSM